MTTLNLAPQYINVLKALGSIEENIEEAIRHYIIEKIGERIGKLQHEISIFQNKYELPYEKFYVNITTNEEYINKLRQSHPTWERDFNAWEFYVKELGEWLGHLENISRQ